MLEKSASAPVSCGEWLQGWLDGEAVLVSCPIDRRVRACIRRDEEAGLRVLPADRLKAAQAARLLLGRANGRLEASASGFTVTIGDHLPVGRGYATSTADLCAVSAALAAALEIPLTPADLAALACQIEPSDSIMFSDWSLLAYRTGAWHFPLGPALRLTLVILDSGAPVDTQQYNRELDLDRVAALEGETRQALVALQTGIREGDARLLGEAARISARAYQRIVYSPLVAQSLDWAQAFQAGGPLRAHSGSLAGLLFTDDEEARAAARRLAEKFRGEITLAHTAPGGILLDGI